MKRFIIITLLIIPVFYLLSCEKFLDVHPKTELEQDAIFSNEQGFKDALTGVYIKMRSDNSYGSALTQTYLENLVGGWDVTAGSVEQKIGLYNFSDATVTDRFNAIFKQQYSTLASINDILGHLETHAGVFKDKNLWKLIKSECLGLRAYIHLDLLRLYGPIPSEPTKGNNLAYVTKFSKEINQRISFEDYKGMLLKDLDDAAALAKDIDPITQFSIAQLRTPSEAVGFNPADNFYAFRYLKMNYFAVRALQARAQLWFGRKEEAFLAAKEVIDAKNTDGTVKFPLGTSISLNNKNYTLTDEHVFGLYDFQMYTKYLSKYSNMLLKKGSTESVIKTTLFGNTGKDIREISLWQFLTAANGSKSNVIRKYEMAAPNTVTSLTDFKQIPLIRISELYLIASECASFSDGVGYFQQFRTSRGIGDMAAPTNEAALLAEIIKEYRKEFYAEGQAFYTYKRNNSPRTAIVLAPTNAVINYLLPLPNIETIND